MAIEEIIKANIKGLKIIIKGRDNQEWEKFGSDDYEWHHVGVRDFYNGKISALKNVLRELK